MGGCGTSRCLISYITMNLKPIHNQYFCWHLWNFKLSQSYRACIDPFLFYTNDVNKTQSIDARNAFQVPALWFRNRMVESDTHYHFTQDQLSVPRHLHKDEKGTRLTCRWVFKESQANGTYGLEVLRCLLLLDPKCIRTLRAVNRNHSLDVSSLLVRLPFWKELENKRLRALTTQLNFRKVTWDADGGRQNLGKQSCVSGKQTDSCAA